jgi:putative two-component system response regulator
MTKILIIDDRVDNLVSAKAIINKYEPDYEVIVSQTGSQGIEMAQSDDPDTVVLDINMPQMDGYEVCSRLRSMEATKHIPIIFLTAVRTSLVDRIKGLEIGGDAYLTKPLNPAELMAQIKVMLRIKRAEDSLRQDKDLLAREVDRKTKTLQ